jgi:hypothetical protein
MQMQLHFLTVDDQRVQVKLENMYYPLKPPLS